MVLSFGLLKSGLFTESENTGIGMGTDPQQAIINEVATGLYYLGLYTGVGFNSSKAGAGSNTGTTTIQFTAAQLAKYNYLFTTVTFTAACSGFNNTACATFRVETQETGGGGGGWSDLLGTSNIVYGCVAEGLAQPNEYECESVELVKSLTAGEKANGIDVKFTSISGCAVAGDSASFTSKNVTFKGCA